MIIRSRRGGRNQCPPLFFLDGQAVGNAIDVNIDNFVNVNQVSAVETYSGVAQTPIEFTRTGSECGVIAIWTKG